MSHAARRTPHAARSRGQAAVEMVIAVFIGLVFIVASFNVWAWLARAIVQRQLAFQATREQAGHHGTAGCPRYYRQGKLSVFGEPSVPNQQNQLLLNCP